MWQLVLVLVLVIAILAALSVLLGRDRRRTWRRFARRHGFRYREVGGRPVVEGSAGGRPLRLAVLDEGSDRGFLGLEEARMSLQLRGRVPPGLEVSQGGPLVGDLNRRLEEGCLETGDEEFDRELVVRGQDPDEVRGWLGPRRKEALLALAGIGERGRAGLEGQELFLQEREMLTRSPRLEARLQALLRVAEALDAVEGA